MTKILHHQIGYILDLQNGLQHIMTLEDIVL